MQILYMVFHFPPISGGGVVVAAGIANSFAELGNEVTVITPDVDWVGERYEPKIHSSVKIVKVKTPSRSKLKIAARRCKENVKKKGIELGRSEKFDFIFSIFHPFHLVPRAAVSCGKELGIPVIIKIDDAVYEKSSGLKSIQRKIEKIYNSKTLQNATRILVSNQDTKHTVSTYYKVPRDKISVVPNGIELSHFYTKNVSSKRVIFSGVMYYHRGIDVLLNALPKIAKNVPDMELFLLGVGPEMQKLKDIVDKKNLSRNVVFKGWVNREEIPQYLSESAIGVGPLRATTVTKNALPIKVLEYMASSLPIVAMEDTLPTNVLQNEYNGYFVKNVDELADKVIFLLENEKTRRDMGRNSRDLAAKFDWKNVIKLILDEYQKCKTSSSLE